MISSNFKKESRLKRKKRIRKKLSGSQDRPRLCVFRSAKHIYAQIIDDTDGKTVASVSTVDKAFKEHPKFESKVEASYYAGTLIAKRGVEKGIKQVVFDRNGFLYHGRVKALSEGARKEGLIF